MTRDRQTGTGASADRNQCTPRGPVDGDNDTSVRHPSRWAQHEHAHGAKLGPTLTPRSVALRPRQPVPPASGPLINTSPSLVPLPNLTATLAVRVAVGFGATNWGFVEVIGKISAEETRY